MSISSRMGAFQGGAAAAAPAAAAGPAAYHQLSLDKHGRPVAISCHAWNAARNQLAFCPNNNELHIASWDGSKFTVLHVLKEHAQIITSVDWAPKRNLIVSCSQDRNAFVWAYEEDKKQWNPTLVMLHVNRAVTCVRWSPSELKFAAASGNKTVTISHFDSEYNWWASKAVEGVHGSTVLTVAWHPSDTLIATGCSDGVCRIISVSVKGFDSKPKPVFGASKPSKFGLVEASFNVGSWVHSVAFSASGTELAFASHDSCVHVVNVPTDRRPTQEDLSTVPCRGLPFRTLMYLGANKLIACGHDCNPTYFSKVGDAWREGKKLDTGSAAVAKSTSAMSSALKKFESVNSRAGEDATSSNLDTKHQNAISDMRVFQGDASNVTEFTTTGVDGRLVFWQMASIESALGALTL